VVRRKKFPNDAMCVSIELTFTLSCDGSFETRRSFAPASNHICVAEKTGGNLVPLDAISPTQKKARQHALVANLPGRAPLISLCRVSFRGLAVQSCGGMANLLLPPGHVVG